MTLTYQEFLRRKGQSNGGGGIKPIWLPDFLFDFQAAMVEWSLGQARSLLAEDCGLGKGLPPGSPVLTPEGWRPIGDLVFGDEVIGASGHPVIVVGIYSRGVQPLFRMRFSDGSSTVCDAEHLWNVRTFNDAARERPWRTISTADLAASRMKYGSAQQSRTWQIPLVGEVQFAHRAVPLDPYVLGILLGDGSLSSKHSVSWTKPDREIADEVCRRLPDGVYVKKSMRPGSCATWSIVTAPQFSPNPVLDALRGLGLMVDSPSKFVPNIYLFNSPLVRRELLQGLMDTDGYSGESPEFSSSSQRLAEAIVFLVRSLGGTARLTVKEFPQYEYRGERRTGLPSYRVTMTLPAGVAPFALSRKADKFQAPSRGLGRWIDAIEPYGVGPTVCIKVAAPDGLFVVDEFVVTHNTVQELVWSENVLRHTNLPVLLVTPLAVGPQIVAEGERFGIEARVSRDGKAHRCITVTNYERLHLFEPSDFSGMVCDESSAIKSFNGKHRAEVTAFMRHMRFRLLATATAAPNDYTELGTSSEALGELGLVDMLNRFFKNEQNTSDTAAKWRLHSGKSPREFAAKWRFKGHAREPFWRWVCSWARAMRRPSDLGFDDSRFVLPQLIEREHLVQAKSLAPGMLFDMPAQGLAEEREEARRTIRERCERVAELVAAHRGPSVSWCHLNPEGDLLARLIPGSVQVSGSDSTEAKEEKLAAFSSGQIEKLLIKPKIGAFGLNWQHCDHMTEFPAHSFEQRYQAIRRLWRFGQRRPVTVDTVTTESGQGVLANQQRKAMAADQMFTELVRHMNDALRIERSVEHIQEVETPAWLSSTNV